MAVFLTLILSGKLHTDGEFSDKASALQKETDAHAETRRALEVAMERADSAVRATTLIADALTSAQARPPRRRGGLRGRR
jgi:hypothetical protein